VVDHEPTIKEAIDNEASSESFKDSNKQTTYNPLSERRFRLPIIVYHSIDDYGTSLSVSPTLFQKQVRFLAEHGWKTLHLRTVLKLLDKRQSIPRKSVVLTFDDAFPTVLEQAQPIMNQYGMTGTTFVVTSQVGLKPEWFRLDRRYKERALLDRDELDRLADSGWEVLPHTHDHPVLTHLPLAKQITQISTSRERIQEWYGTDASILAYPFGQFNSETQQAMREVGMSVGLSLRFSVRISTATMFDWPRIGSAWFKDSEFRQHLGLAGLLELYVKLKQRIKGDRSRHFQNPSPETTRGL